MDKNETHRKITEELYLEGVRNLLLEYSLSILNGDYFAVNTDVKDIKKYIHRWVDARFPEKIIEDKDSTTHE